MSEKVLAKIAGRELTEKDYQAFLNGEVRYMSLKKANPANAERMYAENEANAKAHYEYLSKLGALYNEE